MGVRDLSDEQLASYEHNYRQKGKTEGGVYSLAAILREKLRRSGSTFSGKALVSKIIRLAHASNDGLVSYKDLWSDLYPERGWKANASIKALGKDLGAAVHYCVEHGLPIVTVLVVRQKSRKLTDAAIQNIFSEAKELGVITGPAPDKFVAEQRLACLQLIPDNLPN